MGSAKLIIGDVFEVMKTIPDGSVDLLMTSPPFLALRSYLPSEHPQKHLEIGSEPTPAAFLDTLLALTAEWRRVLAPHGSICVELGDTYSGSGGAGGDYGWHRTGQRGEQADNPHGTSYRRGGQAFQGSKAQSSDSAAWPQAKSLCFIPQLYGASLAYGRNLLTGEPSPAGQWRVRNIVRWCRPNPPVGALGDKFRPATSEMTIACVSGSRYFDLDGVRQAPAERSQFEADYRETRKPDMANGEIQDGAHRFDKRTASNPAGAPPLDWWEIPTQPYAGSHYATWPTQLLVRPIKAMVPRLVCPSCGPIQSSHDRESLPRVWRPDYESESDEVLREELRFDCDSSEQDSGGGFSWPTSVQPAGLHGVPVAGTPDGEQVRGGVRASASDGGALGSPTPNGRGRSPQERQAGRQPHREPGASNQVATRPDEQGHPEEGPSVPPLRRDGVGLGDCPSCGSQLRRGVCLDPFAGSGTTLAVALGLGRDSIGIDLDERNALLAVERCGMFLEVEHFNGEAVA